MVAVISRTTALNPATNFRHVRYSINSDRIFSAITNPVISSRFASGAHQNELYNPLCQAGRAAAMI
jgi:hypothetical protein